MIKEYFEKNSYVYLTGALSKEECAKITNYIWQLKLEGKLVQDEQCPKSWSVYGDPVLDEILKRLAAPLNQQLGINLLPTYTYCRLYQPGEILKRHIDRPSCEISGTLTLGHDPESEIWPIFFSRDASDVAGNSLAIDVGDLVIYRGNDLTHWRPEYRGRWQVQVFFHYVDADGPHKEWANDKRETLGIQKQAPVTPIVTAAPSTAQYNAIIINDGDNMSPGPTTFHEGFKPELAFTREECNRIIEIAKKQYAFKARVGTDNGGNYADNIRRVDNYHIAIKDDTKWIFDKIINAVHVANHEYFNFELLGIIHELQLLHYKSEEAGFYDWHVDVGNGSASKRKLSVVAMLSDPSEYEGGNLIVNIGTEVKCINTKGSINMFPSYALHTVTPVTKGDRWVLVVWIHGSQRFK